MLNKGETTALCLARQLYKISHSSHLVLHFITIKWDVFYEALNHNLPFSIARVLPTTGVHPLFHLICCHRESWPRISATI